MAKEEGGVPGREHPRRWARKLGVPLTVVAAVAVAVVLILRGCSLLEREQYYIEDEVLVSGPEGEVDAVVDAVRSALKMTEQDLTQTQRLYLDFLAELPEDCQIGLARPSGEADYVVDRYLIRGDASVAEVVQQVEREARARGLDVAPEPNYVIGRPPGAVSGDPWSVEASPWSVEASPWSVEASPWSVEASPSGDQVNDAVYGLFSGQWALNVQEGVGLSAVAPEYERWPRGGGVRVGIFDTSPFPVNVASAVFSMDPPLDLRLVHTIPGDLLEPDMSAADVSDHGLFAAGLVHAIAPDSEIELIRVLDDSGRGDLQTLNGALITFIRQVVEDQDRLHGAVINLSLGAHLPPDAPEQGLPEEIVSLNTILRVAQCHGIVVVAAAGNDSAESATPLPMQVPAGWDSSLGVAASNCSKRLSCFSNAGEVNAPGGEGGKLPDGCESMLDECSEDCEYGLISLSLASNWGYTYWTGTSFSAPLVSGLAATVLDRGADESGWLTPDQVREAIVCGAGNSGVVNVPGTLEDCMPR
jgi:subtilisin family serine protease